jgi:ferredoxin
MSDERRAERTRCVRCGFCAAEDLRVPEQALDTGRRSFERCEVCGDQTTHRTEEVRADG